MAPSDYCGATLSVALDVKGVDHLYPAETRDPSSGSRRQRPPTPKIDSSRTCSSYVLFLQGVGHRRSVYKTSSPRSEKGLSGPLETTLSNIFVRDVDESMSFTGRLVPKTVIALEVILFISRFLFEGQEGQKY